MTSVPISTPQIPDNACCVAYLRVSTEKQARDDAVSLPDQRKACEGHALALGLKLDAVVEDRASGRKINRPGFQVLLAFCEAHPRRDGERGVVLCLDSSRWGRFVKRPSLANTFADRLYLAGWDLHFVREPATGNEDADLFLGSARSVASATESRRIGYRASTGMRSQARLGHWQGRPPFGYDRLAVNPSTSGERRLAPYEHAAKGERCRLIPNDDAPTVTRVFAWASRGDTFQQIADGLNAGRVHGPFDIYPNRGRKEHWTADTVRAVLANPVYMGVHRFNRRTSFDTHGKRKVRPEEEHIVIEDVHPTLVDPQTFESVQRRFTSLGPRPRSSPYLLTGLITCAQCGGKLIGGGGSRPNAPDPERKMIYKCRKCRAPMLTVGKRWLEARVINLVADFVTQLVESGEFEALVSEVLARQRSVGRSERAALERRCGVLVRQRERLVEAVAKGTLTNVEVRRKLDAVRAELDEIVAALERGRFGERSATLSPQDVQALKARARDFPTRLDEASSMAARQLLVHWLDNMVIDGDRRRVTVTLCKLPLLANRSPARRDPVRRCSRGAFPRSYRR
jgi:DNA invertase Pin-like site-specific DNA recombinase